MIHHITINKAVLPDHKPNVIKNGHQIYATRTFYIDYHKDNENVIYFTNLKYALYPFTKMTKEARVNYTPLFECIINYNDKYPVTPEWVGHGCKGDFEIIIIPISKTFIISGTSSSGKTTLTKDIKGFKVYHLDDVICKGIGIDNEVNLDTFNNIAHRGPTQDTILKRIIGYKVVLEGISMTPFNDCFNILIYAPLEQMMINIRKRSKDDARYLGPFNNYVSMFEVIGHDSEYYLDIIDRPTFEKNLLKHLKFLFQSKMMLKQFSCEIFSKLGANDDSRYKVVPRHNWDIAIINTNITQSKKALLKFMNSVL